MKTQLLVMFGGRSGEYEVSLVSAAAVLRNIPAEKYDITTVGITREGKWYRFDGDADSIENGSWTTLTDKLTPCAVSPDYGDGSLILFEKDGVSRIRIDVCLPVIHGTQGEDGTLQGVVTHLIFKGVHYEMEVTTANGYEWLVHSTDMFPVGKRVGIHVDPFDIQIMNKPTSEDEEAVGVNE